MDDDEQVSFAELTDQLGEKSVEEQLADALSSRYERIESLDKPDNKVLLKDHLLSSIPQLNQDKNVPQEEWVDFEERFEELIRTHPHDLDKNAVVSAKSRIWEFMTGKRSLITVEDEDGNTHRPTIIDTENPENNEFAVARQYQYQHRAGDPVRPDIVVFVNGIPLYIVEVKSTGSSGDAKDAIADVRSQYEEDAPSMFMTAIAGVGVADQGVDVDDEEYIAPLYYRGYNVPERFESPWYNDAEDEEYTFGSDAFAELCEPERVIEMFAYGQFYTDEDEHIVARHQQYFVARKIVQDVADKVRKCSQSEGAERFQELVSHVQGSGKTYAMLFAARWVHSEILKENVRMLVVVDRENLDEAVESHLNSISGWGFTHSKAQTTRELRRLITETDTKLILTTIQKIGQLENEVVEEKVGGEFDTARVSSLTNDVFISFEDEVHREMLNKQGAIFKAVFPKLIRYGFTGTPTEEIVSEMGGSPPNIFLHEYSLQQALREGVTVKVRTKERVPERIDISNGSTVDETFEQNLKEEGYTVEGANEMIQRTGYSKFEEFWPKFRKRVAQDIANDFEGMYFNSGWKAMVVCGSKKLAAQYAELLQDEFSEKVVQPVYSRSNTDDEIVQEMLELDKSSAIKKFKKDDDPLQVLVVCQMLLTGFDAPSLKCMYLNRDISQEHTLLQALARVNRPADGKEFGRILDYKGATEDLQVRLEGTEFTTLTEDTEELAEEYFTALEECRSTFDVDSWNEFKMKLNSGKNRFVKQRLLSDDEAETEFKKSFKRAKSLRGRLYPDTKALEFEPIFNLMAYIYRMTGDEKNISGLAEAVGRAGGRTLDEEVELEMFEEEDSFEISAEMLDGLETEVELKEEVAQIEEKVREMEREYSQIKFSDRVQDLYSRWEQGKLTESDIRELEKELEEYEEDTISVEAQKVKNVVSANANIELSDSEAEDIVDKLQNKSLHLSDTNTNKIIGNLANSNEFLLDDFGLVKECVEAVKET